MADWSTYELDDIVWDVQFGYQNNHAVPHASDGYCYNRGYYHNKPRHNMADFLGKEQNNEILENNIIQKSTFPRLQDYSWSDGTKVSSTDKGMDEVGALALDDAEMPSNCVNPQSFLIDDDEFSLDGPIFQNTEGNMCSFSFDIASESGNLGFPENQLHGNVNNDHWNSKCLQSQDISQFEDVAQTFRTSKRKHDNPEDMDELSWLFSSSQTNSGDSIDGRYSGVQSSQLDSNASKDSLAHQESSTLICPNKCESTIIDDGSSTLVYRSFAQWLDADGADMVVSTMEQPCNYQGKTPSTRSKLCKKSEKVNRLSNEVSVEAYRHHECVSEVDMPENLPTTPSLIAEKEMEENLMQKVEAKLTIDNPDKHFASQTLSANQNLPKERVHKLENQTRGDYQIQDSSKENTVHYNGFSSRSESFFRTSLCSDNISLSTKFQQLRDAMEQLDNKTKLCLRDGFYRLADSAEKRHCVQNTTPVLDRCESNRRTAFMDVETGTNSLDRTIAYLLFHRDSENPPFNDSMSLDSHATSRTGLRPTFW